MKQGLPNNKYKVRIQCSTYNHAKYIEDALRGFSMQQTDFPFVCCVMDDASTDGEQEILKRWVDDHCNAEDVEVYDHPLTIVLMAPDKGNRNCIYVIHLLKYNTWGKPERRELLEHWRRLCEYEALCEGDDYWTDPLKLQKQVDFLESHPDYVMCSHRFDIFNQNENLSRSDWYGNVTEGRSYDLDSLIHGYWYHVPLSVMFRLEMFSVVEYNKYSNPKDTTLFFYLLKSGKGYLLPDVMAVYREHSGGVWTGASYKKQLSADFKNRIGIYTVEQSYEAAYLLRSLFLRWVPRSWVLFEWRLVVRSFSIFLKHFGFVSTMNLFFTWFVLNKRLKS